MYEVMFFLSLKILFENINPVNSDDKTNLTVFVLSLWEKGRWDLYSFCQYKCILCKSRTL